MGNQDFFEALLPNFKKKHVRPLSDFNGQQVGVD
jgi:hypothetical protein